ncbi:MAG: DUF3352 domain-containing protein, partial [Actinomycetota bacterium]|nr:DUF3352 domain-containing protein [Actinomycetota bacterium]
ALTRNAVIVVVPEDAEMYVEIDLLEVSEENLQDLIDAYSEPLADEDVDINEADDLFTLLDDYFRDEFRMTVEDDVMPWIGRHIAAATFDTSPSSRDYHRMSAWAGAWAIPWGDAEGDVLLVIQVRDPDLADEFLEDLADAYEDQGWLVDDRAIEGLDFYEVSDWVIGDDYNAYVGDLIFGRSGDVVLASGSARLLREALETQAGDRQSVADAVEFRAAMEPLPDDAFIRAYWSDTGVSGFSEAYGRLEGLDRRSSEAFGAAGAAGWFTDTGFRASTSISIDATKLPEDAVAWLEQLGASDPLSVMPEGRAVYAALPGYNLLLRAACDVTGNDWDCEEADDRRDVVSVGWTTLSGDASESLEMQSFVDAKTARSAVSEEATRYSDDSVEKILDRDGNVLWLDEPADRVWFYADAAVDATGWSWHGQSEAESQRAADAIAEFELLQAQPRFRIPVDAAASLGTGSVPLMFFDGSVAVRQLEMSESEWERDSAELYRPILWLAAGLRWDGSVLHGDVVIEISEEDQYNTGPDAAAADITVAATTTVGAGTGRGAEYGEELFKSTCSACHGANAQGIDGLGNPLANSAFVQGMS